LIRDVISDRRRWERYSTATSKKLYVLYSQYHVCK